jgi:ATPase subunit of ABC transporter with duplicated ATPase domains
MGNDKLHKRAFSMEKRIERLRQTEKPTKAKQLDIHFNTREFHGDQVFSVHNLSKSFGERTLFSDIELNVVGGERIALIGDNGTGKSTFLKILLKEETADTGRVRFGPQVKKAYLPQIIHFDHPERNLVDTMIWDLNCSAQSARNRLASFQFTGEDVFKPVSALSGGELSRLRLCMLMDDQINLLILEDTDILLLDEPTNHLDLHAVEWLETYLESFKGTVLAISHDRYFLDQVVSRVIEVEGGKAEFYSGNYTFYVIEKERRYEERMKQYEKEQAKIAQLTEAADKMHLWAFMGNDKLHKRAFSMEKRIERLRQTEKPTKAKQLDIHFNTREFHGDQVFSVHNLSKSFGERTLFSDIELNVVGGERIALIGDNGTGKSTFLKILLKEETADTGRVRFGPQVKKAYLPQIIHFDHPERNLVDTMIWDLNCSAQSARNRLASFQFTGEDVFKPVSALSGGELSRLRLCMLMDDQINLLILDEPTNHLDVSSREWIEGAVEEYDGTLLFVSHDRYFIERFATRIWEIRDGQLYDFRGTFKQYRAMRAREEEDRQKALPTVKQEKKPKQEKPKRTGGTKQLEKQLAQLERSIAKQEEEISALDQAMEESATDYVKLGELVETKTAAEEALAQLYDQWEELSALLEEQG